MKCDCGRKGKIIAILVRGTRIAITARSHVVAGSHIRTWQDCESLESAEKELKIEQAKTAKWWEENYPGETAMDFIREALATG